MSRCALTLLLAAAVGGSGIAHAQDGSDPAGSGEEPTPGLDEETPEEAEPAETEEAPAETEEAPAEPPDPRREEMTRRLDAAEALFEAEDYDAAYQEYAQLRELLEGDPLQPVATYFLARCLEQQHEYADAIQMYRSYLEEAGPDGDYRTVVQAKLESLAGFLATVRLRVEMAPDDTRDEAPSWEIWDGERRLGEQLTEVVLPSGRHAIEVRARGYLPSAVDVSLPAGAVRELTIRLELVPRGLSVEPFAVSMAVGGVALLTGAAFAIVALVEHGEIESCMQRPDCGADLSAYDAAVDRLNGWTLTADVAFAVAGAAAIAGLVLALFTRFDGDDEGDTALRIGPGGVSGVF